PRWPSSATILRGRVRTAGLGRPSSTEYPTPLKSRSYAHWENTQMLADSGFGLVAARLPKVAGRPPRGSFQYRVRCTEALFGSTCVTKWCVTSVHRGH